MVRALQFKCTQYVSWRWHLRFLLCLALSALNAACVSTSPDDAPASYLDARGWRAIDTQLKAADFSAYQQLVFAEVLSQRVPFDLKHAAEEATMASPVEIPPAEKCSGQQRGIALLVHGLSDTAFAMRDLALVMADNCLRARTVLLPGHGTRAGDLLNTRLNDWTRTLEYLIDQAAAEDDHVILAGFSLGAVLTMSAVLETDSRVNALIAVSPAYSLSSWRLARWAPWFGWLRPWVDRELPDDAMRYEAMPTRGVSETVRAIKAMRGKLSNHQSVSIPWLLIQSADDAVVVPDQNRAFFEKYAGHSGSQLIEFVGIESEHKSTATADPSIADSRIRRFPGHNAAARVLGLTHTAVHVSPDNPHYGAAGRYRNCGGTAPRDSELVKRCIASDQVWYGLWGQKVKPGRAQAMSTFNPNFDTLSTALGDFLQATFESPAQQSKPKH